MFLDEFCKALNSVKKTAYSTNNIVVNQYLGGDLGIDSIEMLEIWYRMGKALNIKIPDDAKRDIYQVSDVLRILSQFYPQN